MNAENRIAELEKQIEELTDKHWEECRQIALYDDELKTNGEPVRHGRWSVSFEHFSPEYKCSECDAVFPMIAGYCLDAKIKYCSNCGARLIGGKE